MISIRNLTRRYGSVVAVDDVSLDIQRGEVVGLLGHNGAGKTTIMKILTGFLEPTDGRVSVGGVDVGSDRAGVQRQIGYLPENAPLYPEMLVQEYLQMMAELRGIEAGAVDRAVSDAVVATALEDHLTSPIQTLSKGYRQRVGLAQAIIHKPEVLVLDEPTNGLDPRQIQSIRELILRLAENTTIILSTHILQEIEAVCDRVLVIIQGQLAADGTLAELLRGREFGLSIRGAAEGEIARGLEAIEGVKAVRRNGDDAENPGFGDWTLEVDASANPAPAIIEAAGGAGWTIASVAPRRHTLEQYFRELHERHVTDGRPRAAAGAAGGAS